MNDNFFQEAEKMMKAALDAAERASSVRSNPNEITINFSTRRTATIRKFLTCAIEMLLTGKTTLVIKKTQ